MNDDSTQYDITKDWQALLPIWAVGVILLILLGLAGLWVVQGIV